MENFYHEFQTLMQFAVALIAGFLVGFEREMHNKPAGIRVYMMVCAAGTAFTLLGFEAIEKMIERFPDQSVSTDPLRLIDAIVVGMSFLAAGVIFKDSKSYDVRHLSTATSMLIAAAIGVAIALEKWYLATGMTLIILIVNWVMKLVTTNYIQKENK